MSKWNLGWLVGIIGVTLVGLSLTFSTPTRADLQDKHNNMKLIVDVMEKVREDYVKPITKEKERDLVENMINGGLEKLDPYSAFIGAEEYKEFKKQSTGKFGGVGIRIGVDARQVYVESPMVGTPAYEAGVLAGDVILKVDGQATESMTLRKVMDLIQGDPGTKVTLTVLHEGAKDIKEAVDIPITRAEIHIDSVQGDLRMKDRLKEWDYWIDPQTKIAYIRISAFTETTVSELTKVVEMLQNSDMKGLIVDLRNNPGGLLQSAVQVSSVFLPEDKTVVSTKPRNGPEKVYVSKHSDLKMKNPGGDYPLVILINRYSASASEIVAAALQDYVRAVIIGERSFGKGSVQNVMPMENGATALKLTTASYWRPSGKNIHRFPDSKETDDWGVKPNAGFEVKLNEGEGIEYLKYRRDRDIIRNGPAPEKKKDEVKKDGSKKDDAKAKEPFRDRVLDKAIEHIRSELKKADKGNAALPLNNLPAPVVPADAKILLQENLGAILPGREQPALSVGWPSRA